MSWVLFFDGDCAFCSASVRWVLRLDKRKCVYFSPLQGEFSRKLGLAGHASGNGGSLVVLRESEGALFTHTDALFELALVLGWPWRLARVAAIFPRKWRDAIYQWIADRRRHFVGKAGSCRLPDEEIASRMRP